MDYRRLQYFLTVAEELHFGRAAARLNMAQPPLSQQIQKFERELGVELFHRERGRRIELTDAGRVLVKEGKKALEQANRAAEAAQRASHGEAGHLRVGFAPSVAIDILPRIVRAFTMRFPAIGLSLIELQSEEQASEMRHGDLDVGLIRPPFDEADLTTQVLSEDPLLVVLPEWHPLAEETSIAITALRDEPFVLSPRSVAPGWYDGVLSLCRAHGVTPNIVQEVATIQTRMGLVAAGVGISLVPGPVTSIQRAGVVKVPLQAPPVPLLVAWRTAAASSVLESFVTCAGAAVKA